ncbi:hypothetical protein GH714_037063 [Hevea brasiliensis]|uniref:Response regulatory domain-containing protein n=1 Tax=Hevea brasiliensis TaxID=3981 RepID=A0A6A6M6Q2_HEVBR|nr:hypothetical protein GH714_037063 [Hevea brasiliensis]
MSITADSKFHVLAVDDSLIDRKLIERLLKISSYQVTTVDSGSKALEFLGLHEDDQSNPETPSVSPNNNQESSSLRNIPVVIMSSENVPSRITRCLEEGAEEFFLKPVQLSDLHRLKPHMMKTKIKTQKQENEEIQELQPPPPPPPPPPQQLPNNSKRKAMEEGLSPDRTRPRYNNITTVV